MRLVDDSSWYSCNALVRVRVRVRGRGRVRGKVRVGVRAPPGTPAAPYDEQADDWVSRATRLAHDLSIAT